MTPVPRQLLPVPVLLLAFALLAGPTPATAAAVSVLPAPLEPAGNGGLVALDRALAKLSTHRRVLVVGAHPDDEDTALLTLVSRQMGGEAAYLALSRGEGGQNLIGPELGVPLGLLRSEELLAARRVDGARQYFSRAFDFGYTRSQDEALARWPRAVLVEDVLRIVGRFDPQVLVSVFPPDARAGHGQHQAAGWAAFEAWRLAQDPALVRQAAPQAEFWRPQALFRGGWFEEQTPAATYPMGVLDPWTGRSFLQLAMAARSQHRSQDMGRLLELGPRDGRWIWTAGGTGADSKDLFAGIDTSLPGLAAPLPAALAAAVRPTLARAEATARAARAKLAPGHTAELLPDLAAIHAALTEARQPVAGAEPLVARQVLRLLDEKLAVAEEALAIAAGLAFEASAEREELVPGEATKLAFAVWNTGAAPVTLERIEAVTAELGAAPPDLAGREVAAGELAKLESVLTVPADASPTRPYFLRRPLQGDLYDWSEAPEEVRGEPFEAPPVTARFHLRIAGRPVAIEREAVYRYADQAKGEIRRPLRVVPLVEVAVEPDRMALPQPARPTAPASVHLRSHAARPLAGRLVDVSACGAQRTPPRDLAIAAPRGEVTLPLTLRPCPELPRSAVQLVAEVEARSYREALPLVDYPHARPRVGPRPAEIGVSAFPLALPEVKRLGYVLGAADRVPEALGEAGLPVERLGPAELEAGDLGRYDTIVIGPRAYEIDADLAAANPRLLDYVRGGGLLIVQYQQYPFVDGKFAPLPLDIARPHDRITDETAPATPLDPASPLFRVPNAIGPADWQGWVQERGLYFAHTWDPGYTPLLELKDPDQPAQRGGLLMAHIGKGTYVYTGLAFFRQLPAGVPGAFRLFANLLALPHGGAAADGKSAGKPTARPETRQ